MRPVLDKAIIACSADDVPEIASHGRTLGRRREEIRNYHRTRTSNGPTEGMNFCAKQVKRAGRWFAPSRTTVCARAPVASHGRSPSNLRGYHGPVTTKTRLAP